MSVNTGGRLRGFIGRWFMRFEAAGNILSRFFQGTTAVSALSGVLSYAGYEGLVLPIIAAWGLSIPVIAVIYTDGGIFNRKNRERADYGTNFAGPTMRMDDELIGAAVFAAVHGRPPEDDEQEAIAEAVEEPWKDMRDGIELE